MAESPDYRCATNAAYTVLRKYNGGFPKIDIGYIISMYPNIHMCSYSDAAKRLKITHNEFAYEFASSEYGFSIVNCSENEHIIYYNDWKDEKTTRFTLAHELGHILLGHNEDDKASNAEANCFARNLLCPIQIIDELGLSTPENYVDCFDISVPMAIASIKNHRSDSYYIQKDLYDELNDKIYVYMTGYTLSELYGGLA